MIILIGYLLLIGAGGANAQANCSYSDFGEASSCYLDQQGRCVNEADRSVLGGGAACIVRASTNQPPPSLTITRSHMYKKDVIRISLCMDDACHAVSVEKVASIEALSDGIKVLFMST